MVNGLINGKHPSQVPLDEWPIGWLVMETSLILVVPLYPLMTEAERKAKGYPSTREEMLAKIKEYRDESDT